MSSRRSIKSDEMRFGLSFELTTKEKMYGIVTEQRRMTILWRL